MACDIAYIATHGFSARMVIQSGLLRRLAEAGYSVALITPAAGETHMKAYAERDGFELWETPELPAWKQVLYGNVRPYIFDDIRRNPAVLSKHLKARERASSWRAKLRLKALTTLNRVTSAVPALARGVEELERLALRSEQADALLAELKPTILVATYPMAPLETTLLLAARRAGIVTVGQLLSWDNITGKGHFIAVPDYFATWGPIMIRELAEYYDVPRGRVIETGVPHFDAHIERRSDERIREQLRRLDLDPERPYLLVGMSSPVFAPNETDIVEWLAQRVESGAYGSEMQLVVRLHPQNVTGSMADESWLPRLEAIRSARVAVNYPEMQASKLAWDISEQDLPNLVNLIAGSSIVFNTGSTFSIDGIIADVPVILTAFDADQRHAWHNSGRRVLDYIHLKKMIALEGVSVTTSFEELDETIRAYLADPQLRSKGRARVREQELGGAAGGATGRVAEALIEFHRLANRRRAREN